jgi:hypothetical protein
MLVLIDEEFKNKVIKYVTEQIQKSIISQNKNKLNKKRNKNKIK